MINGEYLKEYDPTAFDGYGDIVFTDLKKDAIIFDSFTEANVFINQMPNNRPLREDGRPNRPISAFTLELIRDE
jgi:hypothetical protein